MAIAALSRIIDFALPPRCAGCGLIVDDDHRLCVNCWQGLTFLTGPGCVSCNRPMGVSGLSCAACLANAPDHDGVYAAVAYGDVARSLVLKLKHGRRPGVAVTLARLMSRLAEEQGALIAPVPLHRWRIWSRGFNQSLLIAKKLPISEEGKLVPDLLERVKATPMLRGLGRADRAKTLAGAFRVNKAHRDLVRDAKIIIIDDVYTSGATSGACAKVLKRAGAKEVRILCWARVLDDDGFAY